MKKLILLATVILSVPNVFAKGGHENSPSQIVEISVTENGFEPSQVDVKAGTPVILKVTRKTDATCATDLQVLSKKTKKDLPLNKTVTFDLGKLEKGDLAYSCGMNMLKGHLQVK